jgi:hypothetical protein
VDVQSEIADMFYEGTRVEDENEYVERSGELLKIIQ